MPEIQNASDRGWDLNQDEAKILYSVLRLQRTKKATLVNIKEYTGINKSKIWRCLDRAEQANYVQADTGKRKLKLYRIENPTFITARDTAVILSMFIKMMDEEGMVNFKQFEQEIKKSNVLKKLTHNDLDSDGRKMTELITAKYIEWYSEEFIQVLAHTLNNILYIQLVAIQLPLGDIKNHSFSKDYLEELFQKESTKK